MPDAGKGSELSEYSFFVPGQPRGKGRPRFTTRGGFPRTYTDKKTRSFEDGILAAFREAYPDAKPFSAGVPVSVYVFARLEPPKSWPKHRKEASRFRLHTEKPDLDNILKSVLDALQKDGGPVPDDSAVADIICNKRWCRENEAPGLLIRISHQEVETGFYTENGKKDKDKSAP